MTRENFRTIVGSSVIVVHALCFALLFFGKSETLTSSQQIDLALLFMPITATYVVSVVRAAIEHAVDHTTRTEVNLNYCVVVSIVTAITLAGLLWTVANLTGNTPEDRQRIIIFEIVFGAAFGLVAADLFGKIEKVRVDRKSNDRIKHVRS